MKATRMTLKKVAWPLTKLSRVVVAAPIGKVYQMEPGASARRLVYWIRTWRKIPATMQKISHHRVRQMDKMTCMQTTRALIFSNQIVNIIQKLCKTSRRDSQTIIRRVAIK